MTNYNYLPISTNFLCKKNDKHKIKDISKTLKACGALPLSEIKRNNIVKIIKIIGGGNFRGKINALGLFPGKKIKVIQESKKGPVLISVFDEVIIIGHGMAEKIYVK